jgi:hypothetical protein
MLTWHLDPLQDLFRFSPNAEQTFRSDIRAANLGNGIKGTEFQYKKERILILRYLLENINGLDRGQMKSLADAVLTRRDEQAVLGLLKVARKEDKGSIGGGYINAAKDAANGAKGHVKSALGISKSSKLTREEALWRDANNFALSVSDSHFLLELSTAPVDEYLHGATADTEETAYACLRELIEFLVDGTGQKILLIQKAEWVKHIEREIVREQDKKLGDLRSDFVRQVEDLSRERSRSYVSPQLTSVHSVTQRSSRSLHVDSFAANRDNFYSPGLLAHPVQPRTYLISSTGQYLTLSRVGKNLSKVTRSNITFTRCTYRPSNNTISSLIHLSIKRPS